MLLKIIERLGSFPLMLLVAFSTFWIMPETATAADGITPIKCKFREGQTTSQESPSAPQQKESSSTEEKSSQNHEEDVESFTVTERVTDERGNVTKEEIQEKDNGTTEGSIRIVLIGKNQAFDATNFDESAWLAFEAAVSHKDKFTVFAVEEASDECWELKQFLSQKGCDEFKNVQSSKDVKKDDEDRAVHYLGTENFVAFKFRYINAEQRRRNVEKTNNLAKNVLSRVLPFLSLTGL